MREKIEMETQLRRNNRSLTKGEGLLVGRKHRIMRLKHTRKPIPQGKGEDIRFYTNFFTVFSVSYHVF